MFEFCIGGQLLRCLYTGHQRYAVMYRQGSVFVVAQYRSGELFPIDPLETDDENVASFWFSDLVK
jgi:hypothetical protein